MKNQNMEAHQMAEMYRSVVYVVQDHLGSEGPVKLHLELHNTLWQ